MRLSTLLTRRDLFPTVRCRRTVARILCGSQTRRSQCNSCRHQQPSLAATSASKQYQHPSQVPNNPNMASSGLPQAMLEDLQLLQQHYQQLPFALNPAPGLSNSNGLHESPIFASGSSPTAADTIVAPAAQLVTSAADAAANNTRKRQRSSRSAPAAQQPAPAATDSIPFSSPTALDPASTVQPGSQAAAAGELSSAAASPTHLPAALQLATPPPKLPRGRRGSKASAAPPTSSPTAAVTSTLDAATAPPGSKRRSRGAAATATVNPEPAIQAVAAAAPTTPAGPIRRTRGAAAAAATAPDPATATQAEQLLAESLTDSEVAAADAVLAAAAVEKAPASKQIRSRKRKAPTVLQEQQVQGAGEIVALLPGASTPGLIVAAAATATDAATLAVPATAEDADTGAAVTNGGRGGRKASSTSSRGRGRGRGSRAPAAASTEPLQLNSSDGGAGSDSAAAAAAAVAEAPVVRSKRRSKKSTAAVGSTPDTAAGTADDSADPTAAVIPTKPARRGRKKTTQADAAVAAAGSSDSAEDAAAAAKPAKPIRRTKKVIAAEVLAAASQGQFDELTDLSSTYSHIALFTNTTNTAAWQQLLQQATQQQQQQQPASTGPAAAAAANPVGGRVQPDEQQQQQQQSVGRSWSRSLCRTSGLGSFRQQVWLHSQSQEGLAADMPADAADAVNAGEAVDAVNAPHSQGLPTLSSLAAQPPPAAATSPAAAAAANATDNLASPAAAAAAAAEAGMAAPAAATLLPPASQAPAEGDAEDTLQVVLPPPKPLTPQLQQQQLKVLPNLGYACLCMTLRKYDIFNSRDCVKKTRDMEDGLQRVSELALQNARDLVPMIHWNEAHGVRLFRLSSNIFPWMTSFNFEDLPDWPQIQQALRAAGALAQQLGHRLTFHPSEYCKIAGERPDWVTQSVAELEVHSRMFDEMGFLPATPYNKINIHVGGTYGDKEAALERFSKVVNERLSPNCKARLTVENDDRASLYSVVDLMKVHHATGIPIVFDFHHWKFCTGDQTQEEAFRTALTTWPAGVRPVVHWSESPEDPKKMLKAHSEYIDGPIDLFGLEGEVDVMIESKGKELALLEYRQYIIEGRTDAVGPRTARAARFAAEAKAAAEAAAAEDGSEEGGKEFDSSTEED